MEPLLNLVETRDLKFALWHWKGSEESKKILFIHATGFHSRVFDQVIKHLPNYDCFAIDMRGHGLSSKPQPPYIWTEFSKDIISIAQNLNLQFDLGIGHSMGGHSLCGAAAIEPIFKSLLLIDPIIVKKDLYGTIDLKDPHPVLKRRNNWKSAEEMYDVLQKKKPFHTWNKEVLMDYCFHGLLPRVDEEGMLLACPPAVEGSIYNNSLSNEANPYSYLNKINVPVRILHAPADPERQIEAMVPYDLGVDFPQGEDIMCAELTHFIPMEAPELVASHARSLLYTFQNQGF
ncbi:MAG: alpha/beta hydrolase [Candidatus Melainabacteria bacterium]|nr:alpha/beta hydrolase [Candidatus Melainabacteria bacterium]